MIKPDYLNGWTYHPEFSTADTTSLYSDLYTSTSSNTIASEINKKINELCGERERKMDNMTYCGRPVVDISPGVDRAHVKFMDNLLYIDKPRDLRITHESMQDGVTLEIKCDEIHSQKLYNTYDTTRIYNLDKRLSPTRTPKTAEPTPKKVIFSGPATTIIWKDGTKTTVKCQEGDEWAPDVGIAMCYLKKMLGNKGNYNKIFYEARKLAVFPDEKKEAK